MSIFELALVVMLWAMWFGALLRLLHGPALRMRPARSGRGGKRPAARG